MDADSFHQMKCIRPTYLRQFQCNGKICSSRCCKNWRVVIDRDTHRKFLELEERDQIVDKLEFLDDENIFVVKLKDDGSCPFLDDDLLCRIQKRQGEEFLSSICRAYPRITYQLHDRLEQSLTLTCPIAARLILLSTEPIEFETIELDKPRFCFDWTKNIPALDSAIEIQMRAIKLLQDRSLPIDRRLMNLCLMLGENQSPAASFDVEKHSELMIEIFMQMYSAPMNGDKQRQLKHIYIRSRAEILSTLPSFVLENYLVNEFFMRCYPFAFNGDFWLNCRIFVVSFKAMEFALVLSAISKYGRLSPEELLGMIDAINERLDHNRGGMTAVRDAARKLDNINEFVSAMLDV